MSTQLDPDMAAALRAIRAYGWKLGSLIIALALLAVFTIPSYLIGESEAKSELRYSSRTETQTIKEDLARIQVKLDLLKESLKRVEDKLGTTGP